MSHVIEEECNNLILKLTNSSNKEEIINFWKNYGVDIEAYIRFQYLNERNPLPDIVLDPNPENTMIIKLKGFSYIVPFKDVSHMGDGNREPWLVRELDVKKGELLVDVGANLGLVSIPIGKQAKVIAIEPNEKNFELLNKNIFLNGVEKNVKSIKAMVSDQIGKRKLFLGKSGDITTIVNPVLLGWTPQGETYADSITIDELFENFKLETIDWLKIDVEGAEFLVLKGARKSICEKKIKNIIIEMHPEMFDSTTHENIYEFLQPYYNLKILWKSPEIPKYHYLKASL